MQLTRRRTFAAAPAAPAAPDTPLAARSRPATGAALAALLACALLDPSAARAADAIAAGARLAATLSLIHI